MLGNWRWNLGLGIFGACVVFIFGINNNPVYFSLLRAIYGFVTLFLLAYPLRFILGTFVFSFDSAHNHLENGNSTDVSGQNIDYVAIDKDEDLNEALKAQLNNQQSHATNQLPNQESEQVEFKPLKPAQLFSTDKLQTEDMTKALRRLTGE